MMSRDIPFELNEFRDVCGVSGSFDFIGDCYCQRCLDLAKNGCPECPTNANDGMDFCAYCGRNLTKERQSFAEQRHAELVELKNKYFQCKDNIKTIQSKPIHMLSSEERTKLRCAYSVAVEKLKQAEAALRDYGRD